MKSPTIKKRHIKGAERLMGVELTATERAQMVGNLEGQIASAIARRTTSFQNSEPTALRFDPRLAGFEMPVSKGVIFSKNARALPEHDEDIAYACLPDLAAWIASGALTSLRLTEIYLARISEIAPQLECFVTVTDDLARAQATEMDAMFARGTHLGPLHGVPYALKDLFDTKGIATTWGAEPWQDNVPDQDAIIVTKLRAAGAVLLGKTAVGALAYGDIWHGGQCRNPWNLNEGSSGSSAGSAAAVSAGLCGFAIGTETLGSITSPSHRCGTVGLRPTFGRVSRSGGMALCWSLDKVGPMTRGVEDTAMVLDTLNGEDPNDRSSIAAPFSFDANAGHGRLRVGYLPAAFEGASACEEHALAVARDICDDVIAVELPELPYDALVNSLMAEAAAAFEELTLSGADDSLSWQDDNAWPNTFRKARFLSAVDHVQQDRLRFRVMGAMDNLFNKVDILIGPFANGPMLIASNFTGHPCLHLPAGFDELATRDGGAVASGGLKLPTPDQGCKFRVPQGISLWSGLFNEGRLINFGQQMERALGMSDLRPSFATEGIK